MAVMHCFSILLGSEIFFDSGIFLGVSEGKENLYDIGYKKPTGYLGKCVGV